MLAGKSVDYMTDRKPGKGQRIPDAEMRRIKIAKDGKIKITLQGRGGFIIMY